LQDGKRPELRQLRPSQEYGERLVLAVLGPTPGAYIRLR